jgi:hypothetical protein
VVEAPVEKELPFAQLHAAKDQFFLASAVPVLFALVDEREGVPAVRGELQAKRNSVLRQLLEDRVLAPRRNQ